MKQVFNTILVAAALTTSMSANAAVQSHSNTIIVESPADLPESAQVATDAMYLHDAGNGKSLLYLEQNQGKRLAILDVTDPAQIKQLEPALIAAASPFDFVQNIADSAVLIRYRDNSGFAILSLRNYKHPVVAAAPEAMNSSASEPLGQTGLLLTTTYQPQLSARGTNKYDIMDISTPSHPAALASVSGVKQRLAKEDTGTLFLLNGNGVTVVRRTRVEQDHRLDLLQESHN
jgi:hypothetical protein